MRNVLAILVVLTATISYGGEYSGLYGERQQTKKLLPAFRALTPAEALAAKKVAGKKIHKQISQIGLYGGISGTSVWVPGSSVCKAADGSLVGGMYTVCVEWKKSSGDEGYTRPNKSRKYDVCAKEETVRLRAPAGFEYQECVAWEGNDPGNSVDHNNGNGCVRYVKRNASAPKSFRASFYRTPQYPKKFDSFELKGETFFLGQYEYAIPRCSGPF